MDFNVYVWNLYVQCILRVGYYYWLCLYAYTGARFLFFVLVVEVLFMLLWVFCDLRLEVMIVLMCFLCAM